MIQVCFTKSMHMIVTEKVLNQELSNINCWLQASELILNVDTYFLSVDERYHISKVGPVFSEK